MTKRRFVLTGGGTGGHIYPAIAVGESLRQDPNVEQVLFIGNRDGLESRIVPENGFAFESIVFSGMPRRPGWAWFRWLLSLQRAIADAKAHLQRFQPHAVLGTGGYVSAPVLMAAQRLGIPYGIHEPDAHPGLVNRLMAHRAACVTAAFAASQQRLPCRAFHVTGNPIRQSIRDAMLRSTHRAEAFEALGLSHWDGDRPTLVIAGGSQGARTLNHAVAQALPGLLEGLNLQVVHQTGGKLYEETLAQVDPAFREHPRYCVRPYYPDMSAVLKSATLAVCRAGSLTLSEMTLCGIPTVLVPYPHAAADHQRKNALAFVQAGAAQMLPDADCTPERLLEVLRGLTAQPERLEAMRLASLALAHPEATEAVVGHLKALARSQ